MFRSCCFSKNDFRGDPQVPLRGSRLVHALAGVLALSAGAATALAEEPKPKYDPARKWREAIAGFEQQDQEHPPRQQGILFVGSSSIRLWKTDEAFPEWDVVNRGFGGSQISDVLFFFDRLVEVHRPRVIVFYAGDNDIAAGEHPDEVASDFKKFLDRVAELSAQTHVVYLPIKPSLARWKLWPKMKEANERIAKELASRSNGHYADTATPMLDDNGKPRAELFAKDGLHLNHEGYRLWEGIVRPTIAQAARK